jgi:hypothetical protein
MTDGVQFSLVVPLSRNEESVPARLRRKDCEAKHDLAAGS